jgi:hypothetical protein
VHEVPGRFVQVAIGPDYMLSVKVIQLATRFGERDTGLSATRKLPPRNRPAGSSSTVLPGAIKSASQLCRLLMHVAPVIFPTSVGS